MQDILFYHLPEHPEFYVKLLNSLGDAGGGDGHATVGPRDGAVLVNGQAIDRPMAITATDEVTIGPWKVRLVTLVEEILPPFVGRTPREQDNCAATCDRRPSRPQS